MKINIFICLSIVSVVISCKKNQTKSDNQAIGTPVIIKPSEKDEIFASSFLDSVSYIPLDPKNIIAFVSKLQFIDNRYYISDGISKKMSVFDDAGNALFAIDAVGRGPGEYTEIADFYVTGKHIIIFCRTLKKIITYDLEGVFSDEVNIDNYLEGLRPIESGYITYSVEGIRSSKDYSPPGITELILSSEEDIVKPLQVFGGFYVQYGITQKTYFTEGSDNSHLLLNPSDTIFSYKDGSLIAKYVLDFGKRGIPKKHKELPNIPDSFDILLREGYVTYKDYLIETDDFLFLFFISGQESAGSNLVYDKRKNESFSSPMINSDVSDLLPFRFPIFKKDDKNVVSIIYNELIENYLTYFKNKETEENVKKIVGDKLDYNQLIRKLEELLKNENPILAIGHLKQ